jgi:single-strand DNA-binding protein
MLHGSERRNKMNSCIFIGRTTADIELRYTRDEKPVANFTLAVDDGYGDNKHTSFLSMTVWGKTAESMQKHVTQGTKIAVMCRARQDTWKAKDGSNRSTTGFVVDAWEFAQGRTENDEKTANTGSSVRPNSNGDFDPVIDESELPFN